MHNTKLPPHFTKSSSLPTRIGRNVSENVTCLVSPHWSVFHFTFLHSETKSNEWMVSAEYSMKMSMRGSVMEQTSIKLRRRKGNWGSGNLRFYDIIKRRCMHVGLMGKWCSLFYCRNILWRMFANDNDQLRAFKLMCRHTKQTWKARKPQSSFATSEGDFKNRLIESALLRLRNVQSLKLILIPFSRYSERGDGLKIKAY